MTGLRPSLLLTTLLTACLADPVSGGDTVSGTDSGTGIDAGSGSNPDSNSGTESDSDSVSESGDEELTCEDANGDELGAYSAMLGVALARMDTLETSVDAAIGEMPLPSPAELEAQLNASLEGSHAVWIDWIRCDFTSDAFAESYALCGVNEPPIICEGPHDCAAECEGDLYAAGPLGCEASCIGPCSLEVGAVCEGWCTGTCTTGGAGEEMFRDVCAGQCEGSCEVPYGACSGTCEGGCHLAPGSAVAGGVQCAGTCNGQASACTGAVTAEEDSSCARTAELRAVASPTCEAPDIVFPNTIAAALDIQARVEFIAFLDELEPPMGELFAAAHQVRMMQDALSGPPCILDPLEADLAELTERLDALSGEISPWLLPLAEPSPPL